MLLIDAHVHLYPPEAGSAPAAWAEMRGETHWQRLCTRVRRDGRPVQAFPTADELLVALDRAGIAQAVLLGWYWEHPATCREQNRFFAACLRAHPDRLRAFATLHPSAGSAAVRAELQWAADAGFEGLGELSPHSQGFAIDDPVFAEMLVAAGELGWPVNLHVTDPESRPFPGRVDTPAEDFLRLAGRFPATRFVLAHWGGAGPLRDSRFREHRNLYFDTAASPLLYRAEEWPRLLAAAGPERVVFGSDYPLNLYPGIDPAPDLARFAAEARAAAGGTGVLAENLQRMLGR